MSSLDILNRKLLCSSFCHRLVTWNHQLILNWEYTSCWIKNNCLCYTQLHLPKLWKRLLSILTVTKEWLCDNAGLPFLVDTAADQYILVGFMQNLQRDIITCYKWKTNIPFYSIIIWGGRILEYFIIIMTF